MLLAFNKPYGVLSQFTTDGSSHRTLAGFGFPKNVYPLGRLDATSEGLLLLSDDQGLNEALLHPRNQHKRTYWAQVERIPDETKIQALSRGLTISGYRTLPCQCHLLSPQPTIAERNPPIRFRLVVPTIWMALELVEGKNHQVRKMTAAIGHPTLRLVRTRIADIELGDIMPGHWIRTSGIDLRRPR